MKWTGMEHETDTGTMWWVFSIAFADTNHGPKTLNPKPE